MQQVMIFIFLIIFPEAFGRLVDFLFRLVMQHLDDRKLLIRSKPGEVTEPKVRDLPIGVMTLVSDSCISRFSPINRHLMYFCNAHYVNVADLRWFVLQSINITDG